MTRTESRHWQNGHQVRGGWFHTYTLNIGRLGVMLMWGKNPSGDRIIEPIKFYWLID